MLPRYLDWYRIHGNHFCQHQVILHWSLLNTTGHLPIQISAFPKRIRFPASRWIVINLCKPFQLHAYYNVCGSERPSSKLLIGHYTVPIVPPCPTSTSIIRVGIQLDKEGKFSVFRVELMDNPKHANVPPIIGPLNVWTSTDNGQIMPLDFLLHPVPLTVDEVDNFISNSINEAKYHTNHQDQIALAKIAIEELIHQLRAMINDEGSLILNSISVEELQRVGSILDDAEVNLYSDEENVNYRTLVSRLNQLHCLLEALEKRSKEAQSRQIAPKKESRTQDTMNNGGVIRSVVSEYVKNVQEKLQGVLSNVVTQEERRRIQSVINVTESLLARSDLSINTHVYEKQLGKLRRLCFPLERRISERQLALQNLENTIQFMRHWLERKTMNPTATVTTNTQMQLSDLKGLLDVYDNWLQVQKQRPLSEETDFSLTTAQIVAQQQALEVAWISFTETEGSERFATEEPTTTQVKPKPRQRKHRPTNKQMIEAYIQQIAEKLQGPLNAFVTDEEQQTFTTLMTENCRRLADADNYADSTAHHEALKRLEEIGHLVEMRLSERVAAVKQFKNSIEKYQQSLNHMRAQNWSYSSTAIELFVQIQTQLDWYERWLRDQQEHQQKQQQAGTEKLDSLVTTYEIVAKHQELHNVWQRLMQLALCESTTEFPVADKESVLHSNMSSPQAPLSHTITIHITQKTPKSTNR